MLRIQFLNPYDRRAIALFVAIHHLQFSLGIDASRPHQLELLYHSPRTRLYAWESYVVFNIDHTYRNHAGRTIRRFAPAFWHSDHYVLLACWIARRLPLLAEYRCQVADPADDGVTLLIPPAGRIKPFGWQHLHI
jgi:hypothetical protein